MILLSVNQFNSSKEHNHINQSLNPNGIDMVGCPVYSISE